MIPDQSAHPCCSHHDVRCQKLLIEALQHLSAPCIRDGLPVHGQPETYDGLASVYRISAHGVACKPDAHRAGEVVESELFALGLAAHDGTWAASTRRPLSAMA